MPHPSQILEEQIEDAQEAYERTRVYAKQAVRAWQQGKEKYELAVKNARWLQEEGNRAKAQEEAAAAAAMKSQIFKLGDHAESAEQAVRKAKERLAKLVQISKQVRVPLPDSEVQLIARKKAHQDAVSECNSMGIAFGSAAGKKIEQKFYSRELKQFRKLNKQGILSAQ